MIVIIVLLIVYIRHFIQFVQVKNAHEKHNDNLNTADNSNVNTDSSDVEQNDAASTLENDTDRHQIPEKIEEIQDIIFTNQHEVKTNLCFNGKCVYSDICKLKVCNSHIVAQNVNISANDCLDSSCNTIYIHKDREYLIVYINIEKGHQTFFNESLKIENYLDTDDIHKINSRITKHLYDVQFIYIIAYIDKLLISLTDLKPTEHKIINLRDTFIKDLLATAPLDNTLRLYPQLNHLEDLSVNNGKLVIL